MNNRSLGILVLRGKDSLDFLQRLSTNDVLKIPPGESRVTILVSEKAKIIDIVTVVPYENDIFLLLESNDAEKISNWLNKFIFTEDVRIEDCTRQYFSFWFTGDSSLESFQNSAGVQLQATQQHVLPFSWSETSGLCIQDVRWQQPAYHLLVKVQDDITDATMFLSALKNTLPDPQAIEAQRIEQGIPKFGAEANEQVNPLEAGMEQYISWTKGCYIGQEVVARIDTYKKLQKKLAGFMFESKHGAGTIPSDVLLSLPGSTIYHKEEQAGTLTSVIWSEVMQRYIALGFLKTNIVSDDLMIRNEHQAESFKVQSVSLPFSKVS